MCLIRPFFCGLALLTVLSLYCGAQDVSQDVMDTTTAQEPLAAAPMIALMEKVADWMIGALGTSTAKTWIEAAFHICLLATYRTTQQPRFLQHAKSWAKANQWTLDLREGKADDQCAGQTYLELYAIDRQSNEITLTYMQLDKMIAVPQSGFKIWWWADALFMAPPVFALMGNTTSNTKYFNAMSTMWWDTTQHL